MIIIKIKTDNAAFHSHRTGLSDSGYARLEVARILSELARKIENNALVSPKLMDYNGNAVGQLILTGRERTWL
jgi:hypothetical protein